MYSDILYYYILCYSFINVFSFTDTSSVQRVEAVLSMNILCVTCYLAEYNVDIGCYVEVLYKNETLLTKQLYEQEIKLSCLVISNLILLIFTPPILIWLL